MSYPTAAPGNYDDNQKIDVDTSQIETYSTSLNSIIDDINTEMKTITDTWDALKLSWAGDTQQQVDDFNTKWKNAIFEMFGDSTQPADQIPPQGQAALGKIQMLVTAAAKNYAYAESQLAQNMLSFGEGVSGSTQTYGPDNLPDHVPTQPAGWKPPADTTGGARDAQDAPIAESNAKK